MNIPEHAHALYINLIGERNLAIADLKVYSRMSVGIGDHADIGKVYRQKLTEIDGANSLINIMENVFPNIEAGPQKTNFEAKETAPTAQPAAPNENPIPKEEPPSPMKNKSSVLSSDAKSVGTFVKKGD
jgi:hypothetical protein